MAQFAIMTQTGRNKEAAALATGDALTITEIAWGDGNRIPGGNEAALENEQGRKAVQGSGLVHNANNTAFFEILLDVEEGPYTVRETGLFDSEGDLIAIAHYDPPVNKPKDTVSALIRIHVLFSDLQNLVLQVLGTDAYVPVERRIIAGSGLVGGGDLAADRNLAVDFATQAEVLAGLLTEKAISPATLKARIDALSGGVPAALDTLAEIAAALGNDANLAATITAQLAAARQQAIRDAYPIGTPVKTYRDLPSLPAGVVALELNRAEISRTTYADLWALVQASGRYDNTGASTAAYGPGDGANTFQLFDARGEFERGLDNGRGADPGRSLISWQVDMFESHSHKANAERAEEDITGGLEFAGMDLGTNQADLTTRATGGSETRPRNIAVKFFIVAAYNFGA